MKRADRISFVLFAAVLVLVASLHLGTFLLTSLFGYLALRLFAFGGRRVLSVALYAIGVCIVVAGLLYFAGFAYRVLPTIADSSIPAMVSFAEEHGITLPFSDYASLKSAALTQASEGIAIVGRYAKIASFQSILLIAGFVVALSIFLNPSWVSGGRASDSKTIYFEITTALSARFENLYRSFSTVIGAQIIVSAINTVLTAIFLLSNAYPYSALLICLVFLFGLLPIVGNLISNTVIVCVGFTLTPMTGVLALAFLVVIHKLEYVLDSKIIGKRIDSPMWLTLIGLVVGERLMGISGIILAPVLLQYIKIEASAYHTARSDMRPQIAELDQASIGQPCESKEGQGTVG